MNLSVPGKIVVALLLAVNPLHALGPDQLVTTDMTYTFDVGFGNSIFVGAPIPQLGDGQMITAPKLVYTPGAVWTAKVGLPPNTTFTYRFYNRADSPSSIGNSSNGTQLGASITKTTAAKPGVTLPATKTVYYHSAWATPVLQVETTPGTYADFPMTTVGAGRAPGEQRWRATGFGTPGTLVKFRVFDGTSNYDLAPGGQLYTTYLDTMFLQDGGIYNYFPAASVSASRIETISSVASPQGLQSRSLRIYLPRGYDQHTTRSYPVLYMHDGQNLYGTTGSGFPPVHWNVDGTLDKLISTGQVRELIVVGIDNTSARNSEYTPPGAPAGGLSGGTGDKYLAYVRDTVRPLINSTYRTLTSAVNTGTAGSSLGGIISTFMGLNAPETFAKIGALSPAYWVNLNVVNRLTTDASLPNWRHYLDSG
ncbi:MAG: hypothetical protein K1X53_14120, partial [Candidatus Sumerlaeaceae bacterium]|nr:hypothetical protein [Candidatus Sumerlaeaceae bacterium]